MFLFCLVALLSASLTQFCFEHQPISWNFVNARKFRFFLDFAFTVTHVGWKIIANQIFQVSFQFMNFSWSTYCLFVMNLRQLVIWLLATQCPAKFRGNNSRLAPFAFLLSYRQKHVLLVLPQQLLTPPKSKWKWYKLESLGNLMIWTLIWTVPEWYYSIENWIKSQQKNYVED